MKKVVLALAAAALSLAGFGKTAVVNGIEWRYKITKDGNATLGRPSSSPSGALSLPSSVDGHPVTIIGDSAFEHCGGLTSVKIPPGVTSIDWAAFEGCTGLRSVNIPPGVMSIGYMAFEGCEELGKGVVIVDDCVLTVNGECPAEVELPQNVRLIARSAFCKFRDGKFMPLKALKSLTFKGPPPKGVVEALKQFPADLRIDYPPELKDQWMPVLADLKRNTPKTSKDGAGAAAR